MPPSNAEQPCVPGRTQARFTANAKSAQDKLPRVPERAGFTPTRRPGVSTARPGAGACFAPKAGRGCCSLFWRSRSIRCLRFFSRIEALDLPSPRSSSIRTNNKDRTREMLAEWVSEVRSHMPRSRWTPRVPGQIETFGVHGWNASGSRCCRSGTSACEDPGTRLRYYFTADVGNSTAPAL
jgi:hypothetical protein